MRTSVGLYLLTGHVRIALLLNYGCTSVCKMRLKPRVEGQHAIQIKIDGRQDAATSQRYSLVESRIRNSQRGDPGPNTMWHSPGLAIHKICKLR